MEVTHIFSPLAQREGSHISNVPFMIFKHTRRTEEKTWGTALSVKEEPENAGIKNERQCDRKRGERKERN